MQVAEVITQIKTAFTQRIKEKTWLDNTTKTRAIGKVHDHTECFLLKINCIVYGNRLMQ